MQLRKKHKEDTELHVGPLNDILFILLFFFLLASTFAGLNAMKVNLPKGKSDGKVAQKHVVTVDSTGRTYFNTKQIDIDSLPNLLQQVYYKDTTVKNIVYNGDIEGKYGSFVKILLMSKKLGLNVAVNTIEEKQR
jgi:biopolymer transport protein ExbD